MSSSKTRYQSALQKKPSSAEEKKRSNQDVNPTSPETGKELPDYEIDPHHQHHRVHFIRQFISDIRIQIVFAILLFAFLLWVFVPPAYQRLKFWRAMKILDEAQVASNEGNVPQMISLMRKAILMAPNEEEIFNRVRLFNATLGDPSALNSIQSLMLEKSASPEELLTLAEQALKTKNAVVAKAALDQLEDHRSVRKIIIQMRILQLDGNFKDALDIARRELPTLGPEDSEKLLLATAEMTLKADISASREILLQLIDKNSATGISALRLLAAQTLSLQNRESLKSDKTAEKLLAHRLHTPDDELLALDLQILENPQAQAALLAQTMKQRTSGPPDDALAFARWLNRRLLHKECAQFIGAERAVSNADWLLLYLDALAGQERWNDIYKLLDADSIIGLSDSIRLLFLARAAEKSGNSEKADASWREMQLGLAYEKPEVVSFIAAYALRIGEREQAIKAYTTLSHRKETALEGFLGLIRCQPENAPAADLLPLFEEFAEEFPTLTEAKTDHTYLKLLVEDKPATNAAIAKELYNANPQSLATISIAALGMLKNGNPSEADTLYNGKMIEWGSAPAPWKTVRAAVLQAVGKNDEAKEIIKSINKTKLRPEERALLPGG